MHVRSPRRGGFSSSWPGIAESCFAQKAGRPRLLLVAWKRSSQAARTRRPQGTIGDSVGPAKARESLLALSNHVAEIAAWQELSRSTDFPDGYQIAS
jgi:hypothetical protein